MSKNVIHNFSIIIKNIEDVKSSEDLKEIFLKELTKVSKENSKEKDIVQLWQEYQNNCVSTLSSFSPIRTESNNTVEDIKNPIIFGTTNSILRKTKRDSNILSIVPESDFFTTNSTIIDSLGAANVNSQVLNDEEGLVNSNNTLSTQIYSGVSTQQSFLIPSRISITNNETYSDVIKTKFKKSLDSNLSINHFDSKNHETLIARDFNIKMNQGYFSEQMNIETQREREELYKISETFINNLSWKKLSELMIFKLSELSKEEKDIYMKEYYDILIKKIKKPSIDIQQLFLENDELFLLLKSIFPGLPERIAIQTPRIIYPDLGAQKMYPDIGVGNMYFKASGILLDKPINYNGNELQDELMLNMYDYRVRNYDLGQTSYYIYQKDEDRIINVNGYFYNEDGTFEGKINEPENDGSIDDVYVCDGRSTQKDKNGNETLTYNNIKLLKENNVKITHEKFVNLASTIFGESSAYRDNIGIDTELALEMFAIASVHKVNKIAYGVNSEQAKLFRNTNIEKRNGTKKQLAIAAVIFSLTSDSDASNGATMWDGAEQASFEETNDKYSTGSFEIHMNTMGWTISDEHYEKWKKGVEKVGGSFKVPQEKYTPGKNPNNKYSTAGTIALESTAVYLGTIFWKELKTRKKKPNEKD